ncbi:hypothetical protein ACFQZZ_14675 [Nocardia sp. GCM10030253]
MEESTAESQQEPVARLVSIGQTLAMDVLDRLHVASAERQPS